MVKNDPSEDTKLEEQCNNPIKMVDKYRFANAATLYLASAKKGKDQLKNITRANLNDSWTMFAAMNEFEASTGRELDFFNRFEQKFQNYVVKDIPLFFFSIHVLKLIKTNFNSFQTKKRYNCAIQNRVPGRRHGM